jgi:hypothetical protein
MPGVAESYRTSNGVVQASADLKHWTNTGMKVVANFSGLLSFTKTVQYEP